MLLLPLPSLFGSASLRFFFGGFGLWPKEPKPITAAISSVGGGEGERDARGGGVVIVVMKMGNSDVGSLVGDVDWS